MLVELAMFFLLTLVIALVTAFIRVVMQKWGILEWLEINSPGLIAKMFSCSFCSAFWFATVVGLFIVILSTGWVDYPWFYLFLGVTVAPISRFLA